MSERSYRYGELPLDAHRRLIPENETSMREFVTAGRRIIALSLSSPDFATHAQLAERNIPVMPLLRVDDQAGRAYLEVPNEARTVQANLKFIARDVEGYKPIFSFVGDVLGKCQLHGFGLPQPQGDQGLLRSMAYSINPDEKQDFGGQVRLFPPYNFSTEVTKDMTLETIREELTASEYLNGPITDELVRLTSVAWNEVRQ